MEHSTQAAPARNSIPVGLDLRWHLAGSVRAMQGRRHRRVGQQICLPVVQKQDPRKGEQFSPHSRRVAHRLGVLLPLDISLQARKPVILRNTALVVLPGPPCACRVQSKIKASLDLAKAAASKGLDLLSRVAQPAAVAPRNIENQQRSLSPTWIVRLGQVLRSHRSKGGLCASTMYNVIFLTSKK